MFVNNFLVRTLPISSTDLDSEKNLLNTVFFFHFFKEFQEHMDKVKKRNQ